MLSSASRLTAAYLWRPLVVALVPAGYEVYAVNPMSTSRYRDRHSSSGAKCDAGDAQVLSEMVRTDRTTTASWPATAKG
jgi:hypothetical protein